jgi:hypothetical protein
MSLWSVSIGTFVMSKRRVREYHLICRTTGQSYGGFASLAGAREYVREEKLEAWDIFHGNRLVERRELVPLDTPARRWKAWRGGDFERQLRVLVVSRAIH